MGALYIDVGEIVAYCCVLSGLISKGMNGHVSGRDILICFILISCYMTVLRILKVFSSLRNSETHISNSQLRFIPLGLISSIGAVVRCVAEGWNREGSLSLIALGWSYNCEDRFLATFHLFFFICFTCSAHYIIYFDVLKDILYPDLS